MWWAHAYGWLEENNLWKATVGFWVTLTLSVLLSVLLRPWKRWRKHRAQAERQRQLQEKIADHLDTATPGGLTDLVTVLRDLIEDLQGGEAPDDNGSEDRHGVPGALRVHKGPGAHGGGSHGR